MAAVGNTLLSRLSCLRLIARVPDIMNGGRPKSFWRRKRHPANTRLNHELPEKIKERKAFGGHNKLKALRISKGIFTLKSCDVNLETPIVGVVHSYANSSHIDRQVIVKGSIIQIDVNPFRSWYDTQLDKQSPDDTIKEEAECPAVSEETKKLFDDGMLFAKVYTRPGQVGECNGYILEGQELEAMKSHLDSTIHKESPTP